MNPINPSKVLNSKWTAVKPTNKERHFLVTKVKFDESGALIFCLLEAVMTKRTIDIDYKELSNSEQWHQGWK